jgi:quercetin dioxygenase-like cupin family protein
MSSKGRWSIRSRASPTTTVTAGDVLFVPAGAVQAVRNVGSGNAAELATYVVEKGKPILTLVE